MNKCYYCGFYDIDIGACTCSPLDKWYACSVESEKPENKKILEEMTNEQRQENDHNTTKGV